MTNNTTTTESPSSSSDENIQDFMIGLSLAILSAFFTGSSYILKKIGLLRYEKKCKNTTISEGGLGYLKEWAWWGGMILMAAGELLNFAAYAFAPATLVTPLGALSVIISAILSSKFLKEKLNIIGKVACFICVLGSTIVVILSPREEEVKDVETLWEKIREPLFIVYAGLLVVGTLVLIFFFAPRYGHKNVLIYILICSFLGTFTVIGSKGLGVAIKVTARGTKNEFTNWLTYVLLGVVIVCIILQLNYINKALACFNTAVVTTVDYVFFTSCVIIGSAILFKEFFRMEVLNIIADLCGFLTIISGIFLLNGFKDMKISLKNLPKQTREDEGEATNEEYNLPETRNKNGELENNQTESYRSLEDINVDIPTNKSTENILQSSTRETQNGHVNGRFHGSSPV